MSSYGSTCAIELCAELATNLALYIAMSSYGSTCAIELRATLATRLALYRAMSSYGSTCAIELRATLATNDVTSTRGAGNKRCHVYGIAILRKHADAAVRAQFLNIILHAIALAMSKFEFEFATNHVTPMVVQSCESISEVELFVCFFERNVADCN